MRNIFLYIVLSGAFYNLFNGYLQGYQAAYATYPDDYIYSPNYIIGLIIFISCLCFSFSQIPLR